MDKELSAFTPEQIEAARENGTIKIAEVLAALVSTDVSIEKLEKVCEALERNGIEITAENIVAVFDLTDEDLENEEFEEVTEDVDILLPS